MVSPEPIFTVRMLTFAVRHLQTADLRTNLNEILRHLEIEREYRPGDLSVLNDVVLQDATARAMRVELEKIMDAPYPSDCDRRISPDAEFWIPGKTAREIWNLAFPSMEAK